MAGCSERFWKEKQKPNDVTGEEGKEAVRVCWLITNIWKYVSLLFTPHIFIICFSWVEFSVLFSLWFLFIFSSVQYPPIHSFQIRTELHVIKIPKKNVKTQSDVCLCCASQMCVLSLLDVTETENTHHLVCCCRCHSRYYISAHEMTKMYRTDAFVHISGIWQNRYVTTATEAVWDRYETNEFLFRVNAELPAARQRILPLSLASPFIVVVVVVVMSLRGFVTHKYSLWKCKENVVAQRTHSLTANFSFTAKWLRSGVRKFFFVFRLIERAGETAAWWRLNRKYEMKGPALYGDASACDGDHSTWEKQQE